MSIEKPVKKDLTIYFFYVLFCFCGMLFGNVIAPLYSNLRVWDYENILWLFLASPFLFLTPYLHIPSFFTSEISNRKRLYKPLAIGAVFGIADILVIKYLLHPQPYHELPPFLQPFPYSIFLFSSGAFEVEVFYRLIPLTLFLIVGKYSLKGKYFKEFALLGCILTSIREPLEQMPEGNTYFILYCLLSGFIMNFIQARYFLKAGFLSTLSVRLGHYLFWHILLGVYVEIFELKTFLK